MGCCRHFFRSIPYFSLLALGGALAGVILSIKSNQNGDLKTVLTFLVNSDVFSQKWMDIITSAISAILIIALCVDAVALLMAFFCTGYPREKLFLGKRNTLRRVFMGIIGFIELLLLLLCLITVAAAHAWISGYELHYAFAKACDYINNNAVWTVPPEKFLTFCVQNQPMGPPFARLSVAYGILFLGQLFFFACNACHYAALRATGLPKKMYHFVRKFRKNLSNGDINDEEREVPKQMSSQNKPETQPVDDEKDLPKSSRPQKKKKKDNKQ